MKTSHKRMKSSVEDLLDERRQMKTSVDKSKCFSLILEKRGTWFNDVVIVVIMQK